MTEYVTQSHEERWEILKDLYPLYKEEVYRRREQMMRLAGFGSAFLLILLFASDVKVSFSATQRQLTI